MAQTRFSSRLNDLHPSPIREILSVANRPGMISFAGGLPCPDTFPVLDVKVPQAALQYGTTEGDLALRQRISKDLLELDLDCDAEQVLVVSGSQQGIDLVAKLFIDRETPVAVESPTYLAALQTFLVFRCAVCFLCAGPMRGSVPVSAKTRLCLCDPHISESHGTLLFRCAAGGAGGRLRSERRARFRGRPVSRFGLHAM